MSTLAGDVGQPRGRFLLCIRRKGDWERAWLMKKRGGGGRLLQPQNPGIRGAALG